MVEVVGVGDGVAVGVASPCGPSRECGSGLLVEVVGEGVADHRDGFGVDLRDAGRGHPEGCGDGGGGLPAPVQAVDDVAPPCGEGEDGCADPPVQVGGLPRLLVGGRGWVADPDVGVVREGRDEDYATIIRSLVTNKKVSGKLRKTYPSVFSDEDLTKRIECAVFKAFELVPKDDDEDEVVPRLDVVAR